MRDLIDTALVVISLLLTMQSAHALYLMLYSWDRPPLEVRAPSRFVPPRLSFTVMLLARHDEAGTQVAIERVLTADYPANLLQVLVVFDDGPVNGPHRLNAALPHAAHDVVTTLGSDDDLHPEIFNVVNTVMETEQVKAVQCGVQLTDPNASWYSALNVLECFFRFRSRLLDHVSCGAVPLGRNTVFSQRALISRIGGWDDRSLAEDAGIGLRLSAAGERIRVVYDARYVTRKKTPPTLGQFIRQRARWNQGFLQTLRKGTWKALPTRRQRWLTIHALAFPGVQALFGIYVVFSAAVMLTSVNTPVLAAVITCLPVLMLLAHLLAAILGLYEFSREHGLHASPAAAARMAIAWFPYQLVLAYAAVRALARQTDGIGNSGKTPQVGAWRGYMSAGLNARSEAGDGAA